MKNQWLRRTLVQTVFFILLVGLLDKITSPEEFHVDGNFLIKILIGGLIYGAGMGFYNYRNSKSTPL